MDLLKVSAHLQALKDILELCAKKIDDLSHRQDESEDGFSLVRYEYGNLEQIIEKTAAEITYMEVLLLLMKFEPSPTLLKNLFPEHLLYAVRAN